MAEKRTVARPYAVALFELARQQAVLPASGRELQLAAAITADPTAAAWLSHPNISRSEKLKLFSVATDEPFSELITNLLQLLLENGRLLLLAEVSQLYHEMLASEQRSIKAQITSAVPLTEAQQQQIEAALSRRLGSQVSLWCEVDPTLLGGTLIRTGDMVIDNSVVGKLKQMSHALLH